MKILITGGSGLVGSAIKEIVHFENEEYEQKSLKNENEYVFISSKDCDLTNIDITREYFSKCKADAVIHLAALVGGLFRNMSEKDLNNNVFIFTHYADAKRSQTNMGRNGRIF